MKKHITPLALARALSKRLDSSVIEQCIGIVLSLLAAVRCFLAARGHSEFLRSARKADRILSSSVGPIDSSTRDIQPQRRSASLRIPLRWSLVSPPSQNHSNVSYTVGNDPLSAMVLSNLRCMVSRLGCVIRTSGDRRCSPGIRYRALRDPSGIWLAPYAIFSNLASFCFSFTFAKLSHGQVSNFQFEIAFAL